MGDADWEKFISDLVCGEYAIGYEVGWFDAFEFKGKKAMHNAFSHKAYPKEHRAYQHGYEDAIAFMYQYQGRKA